MGKITVTTCEIDGLYEITPTVFEDARGGQWYAVRGEASVEHKPVYENGKPVYDGENVRSVSVETVRYKQTPARFEEPKPRKNFGSKPPRRKR